MIVRPKSAERMRKASLPSLFLLGAVVLFGCEGQQSSREESAVLTVPDHEVVARVGVARIGLSELAAAADDFEIEPAQALQRLIEEELLYQDLQRKGYGTLENEPLIRADVKRALVQAYLHQEIEKSIGPETISAAQIDGQLQSGRFAFVQPELRRGRHYFAPLSESIVDEENTELIAVRQRMQSLRDVLETSPNLAEALAQNLSLLLPEHAAQITQEEIPFVTRGGVSRSISILPELAEALFASSALPHVTHDLIRTTNGFHLVVAEEAIPSIEFAVEDIRNAARDQIVAEARSRLADEKTAALHTKVRVFIDEQVFDAIAATRLGQ